MDTAFFVSIQHEDKVIFYYFWSIKTIEKWYIDFSFFPMK